ncbi:MAG: type II toxin-antitoxin system VapC family toxin [Bacteroidales bacterium]
MNGNSLLLDTNIVLYLLKGEETLVPLLENKQLYISFITELELLSFKGLNELQIKGVRSFIDECFVVDISQGIKDLTIKLRKDFSLKLPDAIILATSVYMNIPLVSADNDFKKVKTADIIFYQK